MAEEAWEGFFLARVVGPAEVVLCWGAVGQRSDKLSSKSCCLACCSQCSSWFLFYSLESGYLACLREIPLLFPFSCTFAYTQEKQKLHTPSLHWLDLLSSVHCMRMILHNSIVVFSLLGFQVLKLCLFLRNQSEIIPENRMKKRLPCTAPFFMTLEYFQRGKYVHNFKHM